MVDDSLTGARQELLELDGEDSTAPITAGYDALGALGGDAEAAVVVAVHTEIGVARGCLPRAVVVRAR